MMKRIYGMVLAAMFLSLAANAADERVTHIAISGAKAVHAGKLKSLMDTVFPSRLPLVRLPRYDEHVLRNDIAKIRKYYQALGYFDAAVEYETERKKNGNVRIRLLITEGRPVTIGAVTLITRHPRDHLWSQLWALNTLKTGERFQYERYAAVKKDIETWLPDHGYAVASVTGTVNVDRSRYRAEPVFAVDEGPLQYIGDVSITGYREVKESDIRRELTFKTRDVFSQRELARSQVKLLNLGLFRSVTVQPSAVSTSSVIPIAVEVTESKRHEFKAGIGYGTEEQFRVQGQWTRYYFLNAPRTLTLGAYHSVINEDISSRLFQPYFLNDLNSLTITGDLNRESVVSYTNEKIAAQAQVRTTVNEHLTVFVAYNLEVDRPIDLRGVSLQEIQASAMGSLYYISSISAGLNLITVDDPAYPRHGASVSLAVEPATYLLGSEIDYVKGTVENHVYGLLREDLVVATRTKFGFVEPVRFTRDIPIYKRFFSGGSYSVRGYGFQQVGPHDASGTPVGGDYVVEASAELRYPIYGKIKGAVFLDGGNVYATSFAFDTYAVSYGIGTGLRYATIIGPLGLDIAFPYEHLQRIDLRAYHVYLTIGQGF